MCCPFLEAADYKHVFGMFSFALNADEADSSTCSLETYPGSHSFAFSSLSFLPLQFSFIQLK